MFRSSMVVAVAATIALLWGCSGGGGAGGNAGGDTDGSGGTGGGGDDGPAGGDTSGPLRDPACPATDAWIAAVSGTVVDEVGAPLQGARAGFCVEYGLTGAAGLWTCTTSQPTDAAGAFDITLPTPVRCIQRAATRVSLFVGNKAYNYCMNSLPLDRAIVDLGNFVLHETTAPATLPPEGDRSVQRTVVFADGLELDVTPEDYYGNYNALASTVLPPDAGGLCFITNPSQVTRVYGFRLDQDFAAGVTFPIRIPNSEGLPASSDVALYVLGGLGWKLQDGTPVPEADWYQYGTATVSNDGLTITGDPLPFLNWFGYGPL